MSSSIRRILHLSARTEQRSDLQRAVEKEGYAYVHLSDVESACRMLSGQPPDLMLVEKSPAWTPDYQQLERLRQANGAVPLIAIGPQDETDELVALALGADDYVPHGSVNRLLARINAAVRRRSREAMPTSLNVGPLRLDEARYEATLDGRVLDLTPSEFRLLKELVAANGRVVRREVLHHRVFGIASAVETRRTDVHVAGVRKKLGRAAEWLQTVRSIGYAWREPTSSATRNGASQE